MTANPRTPAEALVILRAYPRLNFHRPPETTEQIEHYKSLEQKGEALKDERAGYWASGRESDVAADRYYERRCA